MPFKSPPGSGAGAQTFMGFRLNKTGVSLFDGSLFEPDQVANGKPRYRKRTGTGDTFLGALWIWWTGTRWEIANIADETVHYHSSENVATPDLVIAWTDAFSEGGAPFFLPLYAV